MALKTSTEFKAHGLDRLFRTIFSCALRKRLGFYPHCKSFLKAGTGLEIGGPSKIFKRKGRFPIYTIASRIDNCNFGDNTIWEGRISKGNTFHFNKRKAPGCQYIAEAKDLSCIASDTYDFVLSSHCIEHTSNPLQALSEWNRVLKEKGLLVLIVPHRDGTFDHLRPVTQLEHLIQDFTQQAAEGDITHLEEILKLHDLSRDRGAGDSRNFKERSLKNIENRCLHHHVFSTRLAVEAVNYTGLQILAVEPFLPRHISIIGQKPGPGQEVDNHKFRGIDSPPCWTSPFPSDQLAD